MKKRRDTIAYQVSIDGVTVQIVCPQGFRAITSYHLQQTALWSICNVVAADHVPMAIEDKTA